MTLESTKLKNLLAEARNLAFEVGGDSNPKTFENHCYIFSLDFKFKFNRPPLFESFSGSSTREIRSGF